MKTAIRISVGAVAYWLAMLAGWLLKASTGDWTTPTQVKLVHHFTSPDARRAMTAIGYLECLGVNSPERLKAERTIQSRVGQGAGMLRALAELGEWLEQKFAKP